MPYLNDGDFSMFLVHASHMCIEIESLFVVAITYTSLHHLRYLKNLKQLSVFGQSKRVQLSPVREDERVAEGR